MIILRAARDIDAIACGPEHRLFGAGLKVNGNSLAVFVYQDGIRHHLIGRISLSAPVGAGDRFHGVGGIRDQVRNNLLQVAVIAEHQRERPNQTRLDNNSLRL
jgi:hypothetical protein